MKYSKLISACALIAASIGFAAGFSLPAMADAIETFTLTNDGCSGGCGINGQNSTNNNFGTIRLDDNLSGTVTVTETLNGVEFSNSSGKNALGFDLLGTLTGVVITITSPTTGYSVDAGSKMAPFGTFTDGIHCDACGSGASNPQPGPITFTVTATGGVDLADFVSDGTAFFAADVVGNSTGNTGDVGAPGPGVVCRENCSTSVPEPLTLSLFGAGLAGAAAMRRRRKA